MQAIRLTTLLFSLALIAGSASAAQKKNDPKNPPAPGKPAPASDGSETATLPVTGMMCNNCAVAVSSILKKMDGVKDASADGAKFATVTFDPKKITLDQILEKFQGKDDRFKAFKPGETPPEPKYTYSGKPEALSGKMSVRDPADTTKNVVARLISHRSGEPNERVFNLIAEGDIATKIEAKRKEGVGSVTVTGVVSAEGIKVEKID